MRDFISTLITVMIFVLWFIPVWALEKPNTSPEWGLLYIPITIISIMWGIALMYLYF